MISNRKTITTPLAPTQSVHLYRKPAFLCKEREDFYKGPSLEPTRFIEWGKSEVEQKFAQMGLIIRRATKKDILPVETFIRSRYKPELAEEISAYDLYRFIEFGHGVVLERPEDEAIVGCLFGVRYATPDQQDYTIRLGIDKSLSGKNAGYLLINYSCLLAMKMGAKVKSGIIDFDNCTNLYINLNKIGWICSDFDGHIEALGSCFDVRLPLDVDGMTRNIIDISKVVEYIRTADPVHDYRITDIADLEGMHQLYRQTDFKVVAIVKPGIVSERAKFFSIPASTLQYNG